MAILKKKVVQKDPLFEERKDIKKLCAFITIVNHGQSGPVVKIFQNGGVSTQFVETGYGTAEKQVLDILGIADNRKEIVISLVKQESLLDIKTELEAFFAANKRNRGIGFSIDMTSIIGVKVYQFLANMI